MLRRKPDPRLKVAAALVRQGAYFADIGTDHAYLPLSLLEEGRIVRAVAADVAEGPLSCARENVIAASLSHLVELRLANGLSGMEALGLTDIAICGMGGELIVSILAAAPFVKDPAVRLILQPMTKYAHLRRYLAAEGFVVVEERLSRANGRIYRTLAAEYRATPVLLSDAEAELGDPRITSPEERELFLLLLSRLEQSFKKQLQGKREGSEERVALLSVITAIQAKKESL